MHSDIDRVLITADEIRSRVAALARQIAAAYGPDGDGLVLVGILSGALVFLADLMRALPLRMRIGLVTVSSYRGPRTRPDDLQVVQPLRIDVVGRHVLIVDDILDSGGTLRRVRRDILALRPASLRTCVLLRKPAKAPSDLVPDFVGFDIEDEFVVGYGLDYDDQYRNLPVIATLRERSYNPSMTSSAPNTGNPT